MKGDRTMLRPGIRLEDLIAIRQTGARWSTQPAHSVEDPFGQDVG